MIAMAVTGRKRQPSFFVVCDNILALLWENKYPNASFIFQLLLVIAHDR